MSDKLSQKDAVYEAVCACRDETGDFSREDVISKLLEMLDSGQWEIKSEEKKSSDKAKKDYIGSVVSNWIRKDPRLSSGVSVPIQERKKPRPADDEMKRLILAKVVLLKEGQSTDEIDVLISQRSSEIVTQRNQGKELAEAKAKELLGL
jgi:hypothetical protein